MQSSRKLPLSSTPFPVPEAIAVGPPRDPNKAPVVFSANAAFGLIFSPILGAAMVGGGLYYLAELARDGSDQRVGLVVIVVGVIVLVNLARKVVRGVKGGKQMFAKGVVVNATIRKIHLTQRGRLKQWSVRVEFDHPGGGRHQADFGPLNRPLEGYATLPILIDPDRPNRAGIYLGEHRGETLGAVYRSAKTKPV